MRITVLTPTPLRYAAGDRLPDLLVAVDGFGGPNPDGATVTLSLFQRDDDVAKVNHAAGSMANLTNEVDADGVTRFDFQLSYAWGADDLDTPGVYYYRFRVDIGGSFAHFPAGEEGFFKVERHGP